MDSIAICFRSGITEGHFRADADPEQFAHDLYSVMLGYHHAQRLLRDPAAHARARASVEALLAAARRRGPSRVAPARRTAPTGGRALRRPAEEIGMTKGSERVARAALAVGAAVSPALAARWAEALFFTPPRPRKARAALPPGATRVDVQSQYGRLAVWSWGSGPAVYLVHGWGGRAEQLGAFVAPLVSRGLRAIAVDGPAHGASAGRRSSAWRSHARSPTSWPSSGRRGRSSPIPSARPR